MTPNGRLIPLDHHPAVGRRAGGRGGAPQRRARRAGRVLQRDPALPRPAVDPRRLLGPVLRGLRRDRRPSSTCTSARRRRCRRRRPTRRRRSARRSRSATPCRSMIDWLFSGVLARFPTLKLAYSEGQIGWIPYILERADKVWEENRGWGGVADKVPEPPSTYYYRQIYGCFFDDEYGLRQPREVRRRQHLFETDYPHSDSTWPHTARSAQKLMGHLADDTIRKLVRGNAIGMLDLPFDAVTAPTPRPPIVTGAGPIPTRPTACSSAASGSRAATAPTTSSTRPPSRSSATPPRRPSADADAAAAAAAAAFPAWSRTTPEERAALLEPGRRPARRALPPSSSRWSRPRPAPRCGSPRRCRCPTAGARLPPLRPGHRRGARRSPLPPAVMPTTALAPGGIIGGVARGRPVGVVAAHHVVQLPDDQHGRQDRPGAGHGQHRRGQAGAAGPAGHRCAWARSSTRPASRRASSTSSSAEGSEAGRGARRRRPHVDMVSFTGSHRRRPAHRRRSPASA